jgi:hypothetical protein
MSIITQWECSAPNCSNHFDIDNQLGYDIKVNVYCDGISITSIEIKPDVIEEG